VGLKIEDGTFKVNNFAPRNLSIVWVVERRVVGILDADFVWTGIGRWWLARVNINNPAAHGLGVGTKMLTLMKEALVTRPGFKEILVAPGGYGSDEKRQWDFYVKNGFKPFEKDGLLWKPE
jgi:hypothetical protein